MIEFVAFCDMQCSYSDVSDTGIDDAAMRKISALCDASSGSRFVVTLGNTLDGCVDADKSRKLLNNILNAIDRVVAVHTLMGRCDTVLPKREFAKCSGYAMRYHAFDVSDYRCIFLDTCINDESDPYNVDSRCDFFIDKEQLDWLSRLLGRSHRPAVIFSNTPIVCESGSSSDVLKNHNKLRELIEKSNKVTLVVCAGKSSSHTVSGGVPYITLAPMNTSDDATFARISVSSKEIKVSGFGAQDSYTIEKLYEQKKKASVFAKLKSRFTKNK